MTRTGILCVAAALATALAVDSLAQDVTLDQSVVTKRPLPDGATAVTTARRTIRLKGRRARSDDDSGESVILLLDTKMMYTLDTLMKTYKERNFEQARKMGQIDEDVLYEQAKGEPRPGKRIQLIRQLSDTDRKWDLIRALPERTAEEKSAKQSLLDEFNLSREKPVIEVKKKSDETKFVCGHKCSKYVATENSRETSSAWVTEELELEPELYEFLEKTGIVSRELAEKLMTIKGLPLEYSVTARDGRVTETTTLAVDKRKIGDDNFRLPGGFKPERGN